MNYQRLIIVGNATKDAKHLKAKKGDVNYTLFGLGVSLSKSRRLYFNIVAFDKPGFRGAQHIKKGYQVLVEGRLEASRNGNLNVVADKIRLGAHGDNTAK
jgi:single-stranded DNA-binding protein